MFSDLVALSQTFLRIRNREFKRYFLSSTLSDYPLKALIAFQIC